MDRLRHTIWPWIRTNWWILAVFGFTALVFLTNTLHEEYPDEFDSILGGKYILEGKIPYRDWFQHHNPGAYYWSAVLLLFSGGSFVVFRFLLALSYIAVYGASYLILKKRFKDALVERIFLPFTLFVGFVSTYFWFHMALADSTAAHLLIQAFAYLVFLVVLRQKMQLRDFAYITLLTFFTLFCSMTYIYVVVLINAYVCLRLLLDQKKRAVVLQGAGIVVLPYLLYLGFLAVTGSIDDYYFANVTYNEYYIYNYPREPGSPINPVRYAIVIFQNFANNAYPLITQVKDFAFGDPFAVTFLFSGLAFLLYTIKKRWYLFTLLIAGVIIYATARIDPRELAERNYQASVYILITSFLGISSLVLWYQQSGKKDSVIGRSVAVLLVLLLSIYWFYSSLYAPLKMSQKFFEKYMGTAPYIYDRPEIAPYLNQMLSKDEYVWIGPFEFKELFYAHSKTATKYHWFLQHARELPRYYNGILDDVERTKPRIVVFNRYYTPWGGDAYEFNYFFVDYLDENYIRLFELNEQSPDTRYVWTFGNTQHFDIDGMFHIRKDVMDTFIPELIEKGLIRKEQREREEIPETVASESGPVTL